MAGLIGDLPDAQLLEVYNTYLKSDASNWTVGVGLLHEISRRYGTRFQKEAYLEGIRRIIAIKPSLKGREEQFFPPDFAIPLPELKGLVNDLTKDVCLAAIEGINVEPIAGAMRYELPIIPDLAEYDRQIQQLLRNSVAIFQNVEGRRLLTFGSCFAVNLGRFLRDKGRSVYTLVMAEDVNSPFNNLQVLKRTFLGEKSAISEELIAIAGVDYEGLKNEFLKASDIIFTLGNIYHLEVDGRSTLSARGAATLVCETFDQTLLCLREIFGLLQRFTNANIFTSVSPVPISGYRGADFGSAIEADCVSKSQLRAALNACRKDCPSIRYIPTFEVFRWLPAHQAFPTFGTDDGNARHISGVLLKHVLDAIAG